MQNSESNQNTNFRFSDRDSIHNIWNRGDMLQEAKITLSGYRQLNQLKELEKKGLSLLNLSDPYLVKTGIQIVRLCLPQDSDLATSWVNDYAPSLINHPHPRVRHSSLWNIRTAIWQDATLASTGLELAKTKLEDQDPAVQRVAIWTHGDAVVNDLSLFENALLSITSYLNANDRESAALFAIEEFFGPLKKIYGDTEAYRAALIDILNNSGGYIGLKARCSLLLETPLEITTQDILLTKDRLRQVTLGNDIEPLIADEDYETAIERLSYEAQQSPTFGVSMRNIWLIRDILWLKSTSPRKIFNLATNIILKHEDGDLIRTASVLVGDCILQDIDGLADDAIIFVNNFFETSDNDGSQIVVAQTLRPLTRGADPTQQKLKEAILKIPNAENISVINTLISLAV